MAENRSTLLLERFKKAVRSTLVAASKPYSPTVEKHYQNSVTLSRINFLFKGLLSECIGFKDCEQLFFLKPSLPCAVCKYLSQ